VRRSHYQMRILAIGDPHFKLDNVIETEAMIKDILQIANDVKPDYIACLGDTLDRFANIHVSPLVRATSFLRQLSTISPLILLIGNHDRPNNNVYCTEQHPFTSLKQWCNTTVVDTPVRIGCILAIPYVPPGRFNEAVNTVGLDGIKLVLAHQEFKGANMGPIVSVAGDEWDQRNPVVVSGHIHDYQWLQPNIVYVGTPIQHGYGDKTDKGVSVFTINDDIMETRYPLPSVPIKLTVTISPTQLASYQPPPNTLVKLIVKGTKQDIRLIKTNPFNKDKRVRVQYQTITDTKPIAVKSRRSYLENLADAIRDTQYERYWLAELIGS